MIIEYFLVALLMYGTPDQEILILERRPTLSNCQAKAKSYNELGGEITFGCLQSITRQEV